MVILTAQALLIIATVVVSLGIAASTLLDRLDRPYLFTIKGDRLGLLVARGLVCLTALGVGVVVWFALGWTMPSVVALAFFFATEAVALDICVHRIRFEETPRAVRGAASLSPQYWRH